MLTSALLLTLAGLSSFTEATPLKRGGGGKRGLAFPKENEGTAGSEYTHYFEKSDKLSWMYDWEAVIDGEPMKGLEYVPLLHSNEDWCTEGWKVNVANAQKKYKVSHILGFNEPDQVGGGGTSMSVSDAVTAYKEHIKPLADQGLRLGSPAVTNSNEENMGINWLKQFMSSCKDCNIDFVVAHYYAWDNCDDFKNYLTKFHKTFNKPVWVTEFGVDSGNADAFLKDVLPWLDSQDWIERYAYHMAAPDTGRQFLLNAEGTALSAAGEVYASA